MGQYLIFSSVTMQVCQQIINCQVFIYIDFYSSLFPLYYYFIHLLVLLLSFFQLFSLLIVLRLYFEIIFCHQRLLIIFLHSSNNSVLLLASTFIPFQCFIDYVPNVSRSVVLLLYFFSNVLQIVFNQYLLQLFSLVHCHLTFGGSYQLVQRLLLFSFFMIQAILLLQCLDLLM